MFVHFGLTRATAHSHMAAHGHSLVIFQNRAIVQQVRYMFMFVCVYIVYIMCSG